MSLKITTPDPTVTRFAQKDHEDFIVDKFNGKCLVCGEEGDYQRIIDSKTKEIRFSKANGCCLCDEHKNILDNPLKFIEWLKCERDEVYQDLLMVFT